MKATEVITAPAVSLRQLADEINAAHEAGERASRKGIDCFRKCGERLITAKEQLGHGKFKKWIEANLSVNYRQAARYMKLAKCDAASPLEEAWKVIDGHADESEEDEHEPTEKLPPPPLPDGEYRLLYADPPWRYEFSETQSRKIENQYPTMEVGDIAAIQVPAAADAVLFLWATAPKLREAFEVMDGWGFSYKTNAVWDKEHIGMGYWFRGQHELLLVGTKGDFSPPEKPTSSVIRHKREEHSVKPATCYQLIESMYPSFGERDRIELFARTRRPGWTIWGNEGV